MVLEKWDTHIPKTKNEKTYPPHNFDPYSYYNTYKNQLEHYKNIDPNLNESLNNLIRIFDKIYQLSNEYFKNRDVMLWNMIWAVLE